jgi:hypothetical protein
MRYKTIKRINWFITRFTLVMILGFLIGFSMLGIEPMEKQGLISVCLLLVSSLSMLFEYILWLKEKNPKL